MSLQIINARLDLVSEFRDHQALREEITLLLGRSFDSQRLVQKFSMGRGDADDLISLLRTIEATKEVAGILEKRALATKPDPNPVDKSADSDPEISYPLYSLLSRLSLEGPNALGLRIAAAIDEDGLMQTHRIEESSNAEMASLARDILLDEGSTDDKEAMSKIVRTKPASKQSTEPASEEDETWVMRKRYLSTLLEGFDTYGQP